MLLVLNEKLREQKIDEYGSTILAATSVLPGCTVARFPWPASLRLPASLPDPRRDSTVSSQLSTRFHLNSLADLFSCSVIALCQD